MADKGKILVVDDTPDSLRLLTDILKAEGYEVRSAISGELALRAATSNLPDLVLLDIRMSGMDGYEVCRCLKANPATRDVPVIFVSAVSEMDDKVKGFNMGAVDFVTKPYQRDEMMARVRTHLELNRLRHHLEDMVEERTVELSESSIRYRQLFDEATVAIALADAKTGEIIDINHAMERLTGWDKAELIGKSQKMLHPPEPEFALVSSAFAQHGSGKEGERIETQLLTKDGTIREVVIKASSINKNGKKELIGFFEDITERKASEARIERLTKLWRALSEVNQAIVHCTSEEELFPQICRVAVEFGGMSMAWVGLVDNAGQRVVPVASYGEHIEYLQGIQISTDADDPFGHGPTGTAIRENKPFWCQDFQLLCQDFPHDPATTPWRERIVRFGLGAAASLPLLRNGVVIGSFTLYADEVNAFDEEARNLLVEMAVDVSFALDNFDREGERKRAHQAFIKSESHFRAYFERSMVGMAATSPGKGLLEVNEALCAMLGYSRDELMRMTWAGLTHPDDIAANEIQHNRILSGEIEEYTMDKRYIRKDGSLVYAYIAVRAVRLADRSLDYMVVLIEDITERKQHETEITAAKERLSILIDALPDAVVFKDGEGRWLVTNETAKQMLQLHDLPWQGKTSMELADLQPEFRAAHEGCLASDEMAWQAGQLLVGEEIVTGEDGRCAIIELRKVPMFSNEGQRKGVVVIGRDITVRKASEARIERLTKLYHALSDVNQAILLMNDESDLFPLVCQKAVEFGGVKLAWVGQLNEANGLIEPVASYGSELEYLNGIVISSKQDVPEGRGPSGTAFRENRSVIVNDFQTSEMTKPWHERAQHYDFRSCYSFPITRAGKSFGVFTVYHSCLDAFDAETIMLLAKMSHDISFALDSFDRESERRQAQKDLIKSEAHFRAYFERSMVGMAAISLEKGWLEVNDAMCAMLGYSREEIVLMLLNRAELSHPDDRAASKILLNRMLSGEIDEYTMDKRYIRKDGAIVYACVAVRAVRLEDGSLDYMVALIEDITERKQHEQSLFNANELLERIFANVRTLIVYLDADFNFIRVNQAYAVADGHSTDYFVGKNHFDLFPNHENEQIFREVVASGQPYVVFAKPFAYEHNQERGVSYWDWTVQPVKDAEGKVSGVVLSLLDRTDEKRTEEMLRLYGRALDASMNAIMIVDATQPEHPATFVNPAFTCMTGYSAEEVLGRQLRILLGSELGQPEIENIRGALREKRSGHAVLRNYHKDGSVFWNELYVSPILGESGEVTHFVAVAQDITERKQQEEKLRRNEEVLRLFVEHSPAAIAMFDREMKYIAASRRFNVDYGLGEQNLVGRSHYDVFPEITERWKEIHRRCLAGSIEKCDEDPFPRADGNIDWVRWEIHPWNQSGGLIGGIIMFSEVITERKRYEAEIAAAKERLSTLIEAIPDAVFLKDGEGRWLITNEPAKQLFQLHGLPWQGKTEMELANLQPAFRSVYEGCLASDEQAWQAGQLLVGEERVTGENGQCAIIETRKVPLFGKEGQRRGLVVIGRDITLRRQAEQDLDESRTQLRGLTARREEVRENERKYIAREVHDELGQILTGLQLNVSVLEEKCAAHCSASREHIKDILELSDSALGAVRNIVSALRPAVLDMGIVAALEWQAMRFASNMGIRCKVHVEDVEIQMDEDHALALFRIVQESLTNVTRHSGADTVEITLDIDGDDYILKVRDNGQGFDSSIKKKNSFGLLGIRERVLMLAGTFFINSRPGFGTEILVRLPINNDSRKL